MKKTFKRIFITITSVMLVLTIVCFFKTNAELVTTEQLIVNGAGVRTDEKTGIKFEAQSTYDATNVQAYGIVVMLGEHQVDNVYVGAEGAFDALVSKIDEEGYFYLTIFGFPETAYVNKITARAFVVLNDDSYVYANTVTVRSLAEVAIGAKELKVEGDFIDSVVNYVASNYKSTWIDESGNVFMTNTIYESNYKKLAEEFISDWNEMFATELTAPEAFYNGSSSNWYKSAKTSSQTDWTGSKLKEFFQNETMYAKWGWIFNYITTELTNGTGYSFAESQINAIVNNVEDTANWYYGAHLSSFIMSIMTGSKQSSGWGNYDFGNNYNKLGLITNYNNTVYADISDVEIVKTGNTIALPDALTPATGYEWDGWYLGDTKYAANEIVVVDADVNSVFMPKFNAINYNITYYNDEIELTDKASTYTVENSVTLPILEIEGYDFEGWYEDAGFTGNVVTEITIGSTGDKVYYAKLAEKLFEEVNVTFDAVGGYILPATIDIPAVSTFEVSSYSNTGLASNIYMCDTGVTANNGLRWQHKILLSYISEFDVYEVVAVDAATVGVSGLGVTWTHAFAGTSTTATVGQYIYIDKAALIAGTAQTAKVYDSLDIFSEFTTQLKEPCSLPIPVKDGYEFAGWTSSLDGSVVTEYPGYTSNPGNITYTANYSSGVEVNATVTFDYNGGVSEELYKANGTKATTLTISSYNGNYWSTYASDTYISINANDPKAKFSTRIYIGINNTTGLYTVVKTIASGTTSSWPDGADYVITIADSFEGTYDDNFSLAKISVGTVVFFNTSITSISSSNLATVDFYESTISNDLLETVITNTSVMPIPYIENVGFEGWYDEAGNKYETVLDFAEVSSIVVTAKWESYNVSYELDGGFFTSYDGLTSNSYRTAVTSDLLNDINTFTGRSFGLETFFSNTYNASVNYIDNFFADSTYGTKWAWLLTYINAVRATRSKAALVSGSAAAEYRGEIHNFLNGVGPSSDTANYGSDYSNDLHGYRIYLSDSIAKKYSEVLSQTSVSDLPVPVKMGGTFRGWYSDPEMTQQVTKITSDCTLYASFLMDGSGYFDITFETNSYVTVGESITINVTFTSYNGDDVTLAWKTSDINIATVVDGVVTGVAEGSATITVYVVGEETTTYESINIVVVSASQSEALALVLNSHESNIFIKENLPIGSGTPAYYANIYGSVNKLLFGDDLSIDNTYLAKGNSAGNNSGTMSSIDFITVHYTGNMAAGADAEANASYFVSSTASSIHYTTGNDGVYKCMNDNLRAWHAGTGNDFSWQKTNVTYSSSDPKYPVFGINSSSYFTINGKSTGIKVPNETTRGYGYVTSSEYLNDMGLAYKVQDGYYYMGTCHWHYKQVWEGRICSTGGNNNSIGIESCVNEGSDLWYTWHKTAQLVAKLMIDHNLGMERVVGHHFFTAKDCPQPMLENDLEIWWKFKDMVEAEYKLRKLSGYTITITESNNYINSTGRIIERPKLNEIIEYTVAIYNSSTGETETITLSSVIKGYAVEA